MDTISAAKVEASPAVVKAMEDLLEMHRKDVIDKQQSVTVEMLKGLVDRIQRIEEKLDLLISSRPSIPSVFKPSNPFSTQPGMPPFAPTQLHYGTKEGIDAKVDRTSFGSKPFGDKIDSDGPYAPFGRGRGLFVGGRFGGGRCGGQGYCTHC
ncbi:unnamed protein product [Microthlaspi erraticum]|uniref:Uncharacterized protein n=1 Tax=Microthlaspi erraticum TaxID=1685480 RepID=A0A6D2I4A2_9BRAS|nr:unnamed protein product [Microthlaspi erraticum]